MPGPRRNVFRTQSTPSPVPNCAKLRLDGSQSAAAAAIGSGGQSCSSAGIASSYGIGGVSFGQAGLLSSCGEGSYLCTQGISHSDETERSIPMTTLIMQPRHAHIPDIGLDNNLLFELVAFVHSVMVLCLQYINLYKTVWWLPHSNANYALNFYLIDVNLCGILIIIMSRRLLYCFYKEVYYSKSSRGCLYWFVHLIKILIIAAILVAFFYCAYHIVLKHSFKYSLFLCYPLVTYFILFRLNMKPLFGKLNVHQASNQHEKGGWAVGGSAPRLRNEQVAKELPTHVCTMSPEAIREEVETLKTDFNGRVTQILFNSMLCAYYMGCVPLCFAQNTLYYDSWWVGQYVGLVWVGTFILFAVHYMPIKYLDVFHRCSVHLGHWVKVEGRSAHIPYTAWSELQVWPQEALVKHVKGLFKAEGYNNAAEPGNGSHSRFYFMFQQPLRVTNLVLGVAAALVSYQFLLLIQASQWNHILTLAFLLFSNYYVLFKLARDRCLLGKVYKDS